MREFINERTGPAAAGFPSIAWLDAWRAINFRR
jgi:hypothetical protein